MVFYVVGLSLMKAEEINIIRKAFSMNFSFFKLFKNRIKIELSFRVFPRLAVKLFPFLFSQLKIMEAISFL